MRASIRLSVMAAVAITGLTLTVTGATAAVSASPAGAKRMAAASGTKLWQARFTSAGRGAFGGPSAVSPDGSALYVAGGAGKGVVEADGIAHEATVLAYRAGTGTALWRANYNPGQRSNSEFDALAESPNGSALYVTGGTAPAVGQNNQTVVTAAYNTTTGAVIWTDTSATPGPGGSVAVSPDGSTVFVTTGANGLRAGPSVVAYNAATGAVRWTASLGGGDAVDVIASPSGSTVFILGNDNNFLPLLAAYDATTGTVRWMDTPSQITPASMAVSPDGSKVVLTGLRSGGTGNFLRAVAYDSATGTTLWSRQYMGPNGSSFGDVGTFSPDSALVFIAGYTRTAGTSNNHIVAVWAYNAATGASAWQTTLPAFLSGADDTDQITVSPDGSKVFVSAGADAYSAAGAYSTAALDAATGAKLWALGRNLSGNHWSSFPGSIEVSPDGTTVFVSGGINSPTPTQVGSMVTVAYKSSG
jgi:hypothetical protein